LEDDLEAMSRSDEFETRIRAAGIAARAEPVDEALVLRLLDDSDTATIDAMANAILAEHGRRGVSLVLEALDPLGDNDADDHLLVALQNAWASDSIDIAACIVDVLQAPRSEAELQGAIAFAGWAANHSDIAQTTHRLIESLAGNSSNAETRKTARWTLRLIAEAL
jgi:hypothetical protein